MIHRDCAVQLMVVVFERPAMVGNQYSLLGTDDIYEIAAETDTHWIVTIKSSKGQQDDVFISKQDLKDSENQGQLLKI